MERSEYRSMEIRESERIEELRRRAEAERRGDRYYGEYEYDACRDDNYRTYQYNR